MWSGEIVANRSAAAEGLSITLAPVCSAKLFGSRKATTIKSIGQGASTILSSFVPTFDSHVRIKEAEAQWVRRAT